MLTLCRCIGSHSRRDWYKWPCTTQPQPPLHFGDLARQRSRRVQLVGWLGLCLAGLKDKAFVICFFFLVVNKCNKRMNINGLIPLSIHSPVPQANCGKTKPDKRDSFFCAGSYPLNCQTVWKELFYMGLIASQRLTDFRYRLTGTNQWEEFQ